MVVVAAFGLAIYYWAMRGRAAARADPGDDRPRHGDGRGHRGGAGHLGRLGAAAREIRAGTAPGRCPRPGAAPARDYASAIRRSSGERRAQRLALGGRRARARASRPASPRAAARVACSALEARRRSARRARAGRRRGRGGARPGPAASRSRTVCAIDCGRIRSAAARSLDARGALAVEPAEDGELRDGRAPAPRAAGGRAGPSVSRSSCASAASVLDAVMARECRPHSAGDLYRLPV